MHKFLINTITGWDEPPRARHQVSLALAANHEVVFVTRSRRGRPGLAKHKVHERLTVITPSYPVDYRFRMRLPLVNGVYQRWLFRQLRESLGGHTVINFDFTAHHIFGYFDRVVYYCNDEITGNTNYPSWIIDQYYRWCERQVIRNAGFCIATAPFLVKKLSAVNPRTHEIPLGANKVPENPAFKGEHEEGKITVCLLGFISERQISIDLVNDIISDERFRLVLIGPTEKAFEEKIAAPERVTLTGTLKGEALTDALKDCDVGLALYNLKRINPGTSPNKMWQYLAVGRPVVVTRLENIRPEQFPEKTVYLFDEGKDSLRELIHRAKVEDSESLFRRRIEFAHENTWEKRMEVFLRILDREPEFEGDMP